jgi:hypothetical protein
MKKVKRGQAMTATSVKNKVILEFPDKTKIYRLERKHGSGGQWRVFTAQGFLHEGAGAASAPAYEPFVDTSVGNGIYQYRVRIYDDTGQPFDCSAWVRCGDSGPAGYTFGNYEAPEGSWGEVLTTDDLLYTWLWGIDPRAANGDSYTEAQIRFFIDSALAEIGRRLNITIKKTRVACEPARRGLKQGADYDAEESYYTFKRERIQRNGMITTRKRPVVSISRLDLLSRENKAVSLLEASTLDKTKGMIRFFNRPLKIGDSYRAVMNSVYTYGQEAWDNNLFYAVDYVAGYRSSDEVPQDLRAVIGKTGAVELLNIIGDGLMSGFASSSLSMDGVSESFSSTQSATSAMYGARIKAYEDEIADYVSRNKLKFGHIVMGAL